MQYISFDGNEPVIPNWTAEEKRAVLARLMPSPLELAATAAARAAYEAVMATGERA